MLSSIAVAELYKVLVYISFKLNWNEGSFLRLLS